MTTPSPLNMAPNHAGLATEAGAAHLGPTGYRAYQIFSREWYWRRALTLSAWFVVGALALMTIMLDIMSMLTDWRLSFALIAWIVGWGLASILIGPGLACWVTSRRLTGRREGAALAAAILVGLLASCYTGQGLKALVKWAVYGDPNRVIVFSSTAKIESLDRESYLRKHGTEEGSLPELVSKASKDEKAAWPTQAPEPPATPEPPEPPAPPEIAEPPEVPGPPAPPTMRDLPPLPQAFGVKHFSPNTKWIAAILPSLAVWSLMGWLGSALDLFGFFSQRRRIERLRRERDLADARLARNELELKLSVLAAQIEPHFLFNTLAGVRSAIVGDPPRAVAIVDHLVEYLRATIPRLRGDGGSTQGRLGTQLEAARAYLSLMRARTPRLDFSIECPVDLSGAALPPLMLISLVENAVKHGIEPKVGAGHIRVFADIAEDEQGDKLRVTVADDGVGFGGNTSGSGLGLSNIKERLATLYGDAASLELKALPFGGVAATIILPLETDASTPSKSL